MAKAIAKRPTDARKKTWAWQEDEDSCLSNAQSKEKMKSREHEPKSAYFLHTVRDKHQPECTIKLDKHEGNRYSVKARKRQIQIEVELA